MPSIPAILRMSSMICFPFSPSLPIPVSTFTWTFIVALLFLATRDSASAVVVSCITGRRSKSKKLSISSQSKRTIIGAVIPAFLSSKPSPIYAAARKEAPSLSNLFETSIHPWP